MLNMSNIVGMKPKQITKVESEIPNKTLDIKEQFLSKKFRTSKSYSTKSLYQVAVNRLEDFVRINYNLDLAQVVNAVLTTKIDPLSLLDEFYSFLSEYKHPKTSKVLSSGSIKTYLVIAKEFLNTNGVKIYNEDVRQRLRLPRQQDIYEEGLTKDVINRVIRSSSLKLATVILIACSSSMRIGEIVQLRLSDIDFSTDPTTIQIRKETTKTRATRFTHLTNEATRSLKDYLAKSFEWKEGQKDDLFIFMQTHEEKISKYKKELNGPKTQYSRKGLIKKYIGILEKDLKTKSQDEIYAKEVSSCKTSFEEMLSHVVESIPDLAVKIKDNNRNQIHFHAFRSWFKTQVTDAHQSDFAESLMGHKSLKTLYYRQNHDKRQKVYRGIEHALTISDTEAIEKNLSQIQDSELELRELVKEMRQEHKAEMNSLRNWVTEVINGYKTA